MQQEPMRMVVMGVSGCGKSSLGRALAQQRGVALIEGDDFHSEQSVAKMRAGTPLQDADRAQWLRVLGEQLAAHPQGVVLSCSALKKAYRAQLRAAAPGLRFVFLQITPEEALRRVSARASAHMFPASLVASQFEALESPEGEPGVFTVSATAPTEGALQAIEAWWARGAA
ncbi:gluconokinase [Xenophilus arseniciresistens]|uniref:Gluconokinase n=1 Tax=Xenophilus arseniciresistens TaxID=1283306 RepID=A0AAE3N9P6_9BURK|nr:gluconokinase [Xenophilus arseniciresistens]MDA7415769.1 gluconokinase [Xenophilus arseniciresistens]